MPLYSVARYPILNRVFSGCWARFVGLMVFRFEVRSALGFSGLVGPEYRRRMYFMVRHYMVSRGCRQRSFVSCISTSGFRPW